MTQYLVDFGYRKYLTSDEKLVKICDRCKEERDNKITDAECEECKFNLNNMEVK